MKKLFIILIVVTFTITTSFSQTFGIKTGLNIASGVVLPENDVPDGIRAGMNLGALLMFEDWTDVIALRTGLVYSQKGASQDESTIAFDYLEIPLDFAFKLGDGGFALSAGPYLGFLISADKKSDTESKNINKDDDIIKGMDFGLNLGMSFVINESILIDARYGMGFRDITNDKETPNPTTDMNSVLQISVGYLFGE